MSDLPARSSSLERAAEHLSHKRVQCEQRRGSTQSGGNVDNAYVK